MNVVAGKEEAIERVERLAQAYWAETDSNFLLHGPVWDSNRWAGVLSRPELEGFVWKTEWREKITRELILGQWKTASNDKAALEAFFLTMAWGFGSHFLGSWKTTSMFDSMNEKNFGSYLLEVKSDAAKSSEDAFRSLLGQGVRQLGPVYASKLLYAMSHESHRSPVMDVWIEKWGRAKFGLDFRIASTQPIERNVDSLKRFTDFCVDALEVLNGNRSSLMREPENDVGFVEYLIFWDAKYKWNRWKKEALFPIWVQNSALR